jgi:TetR/AcrR family transcriptional regulator, repressor of fatR-cypB operon
VNNAEIVTAHQPHAEEKDFLSRAPRERILAAALKLFVEQGYFNTNVPDLSRESRCSVGSIYHNFKNKEEVAVALYQECIKAFRESIEAALSNQKDIEKVIKQLVQSFLIFSEMNQHISKYIWLCRHNEFMSQITKHPTMIGFDSLGRTLTKTIKRGVREKKIKPLSANLIWSVVFGVPLAYVRDWFDGYNTQPPSTVAEDIANICWKALSA